MKNPRPANLLDLRHLSSTGVGRYKQLHTNTLPASSLPSLPPPTLSCLLAPVFIGASLSLLCSHSCRRSNTCLEWKRRTLSSQPAPAADISLLLITASLSQTVSPKHGLPPSAWPVSAPPETWVRTRCYRHARLCVPPWSPGKAF